MLDHIELVFDLIVLSVARNHSLIEDDDLITGKCAFHLVSGNDDDGLDLVAVKRHLIVHDEVLDCLMEYKR